ncbi:MAG: ribosome recycling factor [Bacteroidetes bacterium]|nr:ribosome recycling factor [Bacteroidota bacterium]
MSELNKFVSDASSQMDKAINHYGDELHKIRAGKASPAMLDGLFVDYYGVNTPMAQVGNISTPDAKTLVIQPWDKGLITGIEKAIANSNLGFNPQNDGTLVRITIPPLTEERRTQLVKQAKQETESAKVAVRNIRKDVNDNIKKAVKDGIPEDEGKTAEGKIQELTDKSIVRIDDLLKIKEKEIMTV